LTLFSHFADTEVGISFVVKPLVILAFAAMLGPCATAQSVISARSGLVHYFEGTVYVADQRLESHVGRFVIIPDGAEIRTEQGRAEILLNPSVFMRIGENSSVRMLDSDLENTRLELLSGSAAIDCIRSDPGSSLTLVVAERSVQFLTEGLYRINSEPAIVRVYTGRAEVASGNQKPVTVDRGMILRLEGAVTPEPSPLELKDPLSDWSLARRQSMADEATSAGNRPKPAHHSRSFRGPVRSVLSLPPRF
jgi:hypothetical protein